MEAFLSFILISILVIYALGFLGRLIFRWWIAKKQREFAQRFGGDAAGANGAYGQYGSGRQRNQGSSRGTGKEGDIKVEQTSPRNKKVNKNVGDYVDFEEEES